MESEKKRSRGIVFTSADTMLLVDLVYKFKSVLENKKTDAVTSKEKDKVWGILATDFNAASGTVPRNASTLKTKYENLKRVCRKSLSEEKCEVFKTGGGKYVPKILDPALEKIRAILSISGVGLTNPYDSNGSFSAMMSPESVPARQVINLGQEIPGLGNYEQQINQEDFHMEDEEEKNNGTTPTTQQPTAQELLQDSRHSWAGWNPEMLRQPVSYALLTPRKKALLDRGETIDIRCPAAAGSSPHQDDDDHDVTMDESPPPMKTVQDKNNKTTPHQARRNHPTLKPAYGKGKATTASNMSNKFTKLAEQKLQFLHMKEDGFKRQVDVRVKRELELHKLNVESAKLDIRLKRAKLRHIILKNRVLMLHHKKAFGNRF